VGVGRGKNYDNESNVIAYRKDRFDLVFLETFWLSDTPHKPGSRFSTDQSDCPRICTCTILMDRENGKVFRHYNTHLDHVGKFAQAQGISLILNRIAADYDAWPLPVILTGDFNVTPDSMVYKSVVGFTGCGSPLKDATADVGPTFHGFRKDWPGSKIDYVFTTLPFDPARSATVTAESDSLTLSDHYPVGAAVEL
ncbi:MAG: endonuclease/exonuclease/phosphatase family protein, partial [Clostridiales bacterium]|nr:endonuclease/exonuclease/phosphatase family protein [Clostridiales bacterium]